VANKMRDYKKEYAEFQGKPAQKKRRAGNNNARRKLTRTGAVKKGDGKDVHHKDGNTKNNKRSNLAVVSAKANRGTLRVKRKKK
jgi:hypothetical protein|tara:strand:- start:1606 stop:1857 length:252 start_codon:yes stop_codon:yes gene_type:complete